MALTKVNTAMVSSGGGDIATNAALGSQALNSNTSGANNTAVGYQAAYSNTTGVQHTAVGVGALYSNTTGDSNNAFGRYALNANTTGADNVSIGRNSLLSNTTGNYNVAVGNTALNSNTTASNNTAVGYQAGYSNTVATHNTFVGQGAGYSFNGSGGTYNCFVGTQAGYSQTSGQYNSYLGLQAGYYMTTGTKNTIIGAYTGNQGGLDIRTASNYIVLSDGDGNPRFQYSGTQWDVPAYNSNTIPQTAINVAMRIRSASAGGLYVENDGWGGPFAVNINTVNSGSSDNRNMRFQVGSTTVGTIISSSTATAYNTSSDYRLKENIAPMQNALSIVQQLKPVTYTWKIDGSAGQGFIAHELAEVVPDCVTGQKDAIDEDGNPEYQGVDTSFLVATLTAAIQELNAKVEAQAAEIAALKAAP